MDTAGLYGSDWAAAKVAGDELKGLVQDFNIGIRDLCVPLMALVDYGGFRLIAVSILPVNASTIVYDSNDSGHSMHDDHPRLSRLMQEAARTLNVKSHRAGMERQTARLLHSPIDLEGHVGLDNRLYLLDFSRVMPACRARTWAGCCGQSLSRRTTRRCAATRSAASSRSSRRRRSTTERWPRRRTCCSPSRFPSLRASCRCW